MLSKLLKYDFKSVKRFGLPAVITLLVLTVISGPCAYYYLRGVNNVLEQGSEGAGAIAILGGLLLFLGFIALLYIAIIGVWVMLMVDFYKSTASDEAYLTFTLPVTSKQIIFSKVINSFFWNFVTALLAVAAGLALIVGLALGTIPSDEPVYTVGSAIEEVSDALYLGSNTEILAVVVLYILTFLIAFVTNSLSSFTAIFFGAIIAQKHKVLSAIGCMLGVFALNATVASTVQVITEISLQYSANSNFTDITPLIVTYAVLAVYQVGMAFLYYFILKHLMTKKLNLA